jgi:esterase/lipase superfamily enzyme
MQQLGIEAYVAQSSISQRFKISNLILFAPDIDMDVAGTKLFGIVSDPDALYGKKAKPDVNFPSTGTFHLTVYSSPNDRALGLSAMLFGSAVRLGQLSVGHLPTANGETQTILKATPASSATATS